VAAPDLGSKRICPSCAAKFYDLSKRPIVCPKCSFSFAPEALVKMRRPRTGAAAVVREEEARVVRAAEAEPEEAEEKEETEEVAEGEEEEAAEEEIKEVALDDEAVADPDLVVDEETDDKDDKPEVVGDEVDLEEIEAEDEDDDEDDDTLIEDVDQDEDVGDIIDKDDLEKE